VFVDCKILLHMIVSVYKSRVAIENDTTLRYSEL
jgi:hypothetical protein